MVDTSFAAQKASYTNRWNRMEITGNSVVNRAVDKILKNKAIYQRIEDRTGVPWWFTGITHIRESDGRLDTYLGNGQSIKRKTTIVPKGRGPFSSFEDGAYDAYKVQGYLNIDDWSLERSLYRTEGFNGFAYMRMGKASPYVWGQTNIAGLGKYVRDHVYDPDAKETQPGTAALLKVLMDRDSSIQIGPKKTAQEVVDQPLTKSGVVITSGAGGLAAAGTIADQANMAIDTANRTKEGVGKLGIIDGVGHFIYQYPITFSLLMITVACTCLTIYFRWKAKKDVTTPAT